MPKVGIVFCGFNVEPYVRKALEPFLRPHFWVSAVSVPFKEYRSQEDYRDNTTEILRGYQKQWSDDGITDDFLIPFPIELVDSPEYIPEHEARNLALDRLPPDIDYIWLVDGDEHYTGEQINAILEYVEAYPAAWYSLCLKNYVFDKQHYMAEPFTPPRIFSTHFDGDFNPRFVWDNDMAYQRLGVNSLVSHKALPNLTVPKEIAWVDHWTWMNDEIGKRKVEYQTEHFGHCSFKWVKDHLELDDDYFKKTGENKPKINKNVNS